MNVFYIKRFDEEMKEIENHATKQQSLQTEIEQKENILNTLKNEEVEKKKKIENMKIKNENDENKCKELENQNVEELKKKSNLEDELKDLRVSAKNAQYELDQIEPQQKVIWAETRREKDGKRKIFKEIKAKNNEL